MKKPARHGEFSGRDGADPAFLERIESLFYGRDFKAAEDKHVHITEQRYQIRPRCGADRRSTNRLT
jgi:hypothetical protein